MPDLTRRTILIGAATAPLASCAAARAENAPVAASTLNVRDYGAIGNAMTDDTDAITAAINALPENGGTVHFPAGVYNIASATGLQCGKSGVRLVGDAGLSVLKYTPTGGGGRNLLDISSASNIVIENLTFDGNSDSATGGTPTLLNLSNISHVTVRNCNFIDAPGKAVNALDASFLRITGNYLRNTFYSGVSLSYPTVEGVYNDNIWIADNYFDSCQTSRTAGHAAIQSVGGGLHRYIHVLNNTVINPGTVGIGLDRVERSNVVGNTVIKPDRETPSGECIAFSGSENIFAENYCRNDNITGAAGVLLFGLNPDFTPCNHNQITNNRCTNGGQGVAFVWGAQGAEINDLLIQGNQCYGNNVGIQSYKYPDVSSASQSNVVVSNNNLTGNITSEYNLISNSGGVLGTRIIYANQLNTTDSERAPDHTMTRVSAPETALSTGSPGQWAADNSWVYLCTATNTWVRVASASW